MKIFLPILAIGLVVNIIAVYLYPLRIVGEALGYLVVGYWVHCYFLKKQWYSGWFVKYL